jgi:hypothetical protein
MANTTNYNWETPDDTDLVKDGALAIRTLGSSIDTTTKALNPETTTGDIAYRSATANTNTRLGIGTAGQILTVNSGATAPEWATPAPPGGGYTLINTGGTTLSGATTTISSIPTTYRMLKIVTVNFGINTAGYAGIEANGSASLFYGKEHVSLAAGAFGTQVVSAGIIQYSGFQDIKANATANNQAITEITNYASSTQNKQVKHFGTFVSSTSDNLCTVMWFGELRTSSQITSLEFFTNQSFNAGTVYVYGA